MLLEVTVESQDLLVKLDIGGFELLLNICGAEVVRELVVRVRHALGSFCWTIVTHSRLRHGVERHSLVLGVLNPAQVHVGNLLVLKIGRIMRGGIARQLGEVL